jgi:hypothetical protein
MTIPFINQEKSTIAKTILKAELILGILPAYWEFKTPSKNKSLNSTGYGR